MQTVRETFELTHRLCSPEPPSDAPKLVRDEWASRVESVIDVLELREAADTAVGNAKVRGISGGQKKRVTVGVALLSGAKVLALDEATSGLDSSTALNLVVFLRQWARMTRGAVVAALQVRMVWCSPVTGTVHSCFSQTLATSHSYRPPRPR